MLAKKSDKYVYQDLVEQNILYGEDVQQAILDYIGLEDAQLEFQTFDGKWHTTKLLKIRIRR